MLCQTFHFSCPVVALQGVRICNCHRTPVVDPVSHAKYSACMDDLDALHNEIKVVPTMEQQRHLKVLLDRAAKCLSPLNLSVLHACEAAMDGCLEQEDWKGALAYSLSLEKGYHFYLADYHPTLGIHYFKQGKSFLVHGS